MTIILPELSFVVLIGASGSGKSTFARTHFMPTEVLSSDFCRALVADDENDQSATTAAFDVLHHIAGKRLEAGRLTVVDATNVRPEDRKHLVKLAREHHVLPVAIVFNLPEKVCHERNVSRPDRNFGPHVIRQQRQAMRRSMRGLKREGFRHVFIFDSVEEVQAARIERQPLWNNRKHEHGPFDIIGDVHGCYDELAELLRTLRYVERGPFDWTPPVARRAIFLGDLVDRGPDSPRVLRTAMRMCQTGVALCVPGNHDVKLVRKLSGRNVQLTHGLAETMQQLEREPPEFLEQIRQFLDGLVSHYVFDDGKLVVAHAGMKEKLQGRGSGTVREFALYGETTGETDEFGLPIRYNWAAEYRGHARVVYGHTPVPEPEWLNRTINIDTGCVFGGRLTALRYPELEFVSVAAKHTYAQPRRPFLPTDYAAPDLTAQQAHDDVLDLADVFGKRMISTRLSRSITIREGNAAAALEVMSRFAVDPRWLIYLPPTMSPVETSKLPGMLEHPAEAFAYFRSQGVPEVICEQKHMGSRAVVIVCRDEQTARRRFGVVEEAIGICYTRTGRRFFNDESLEREFLQRIQKAAEVAGFWNEFDTDWLCLDCELMPWSAKAQALLKEQYAAVGASANAMLAGAFGAVERAKSRAVDVAGLDQRIAQRRDAIDRYVRAYRQYCWPVASIDDYKLAPFHVLATEGRVHIDRDHTWHMETLARLCEADRELLLATPFRLVNITDETSLQDATQWWLDLLSRGGEGMVVKPRDFIAQGRARTGGITQPAVKCRGPEYLRIIYGPDYDRPENLQRLRHRGLAHKRSLASREFALGIESLERFVRLEPLRRVHECVFGVLALESEPVDPRL